MIFVSEEGQVTRFFEIRRLEVTKSPLACAAQAVSAERPGSAQTSQRKNLPLRLRHLRSGVIPTAAAVAGLMYLLVPPAFAQQDPGVRGGMQNTAGFLQFQGIQI